MATNWDSEMQDKFDKLQAALTDEFRTQIKILGTGLEERLEPRLRDNLSKNLGDQITAMGAELEARLDQRLGNRLDLRAEQLEQRLGNRLDLRAEQFEQRLGDRFNVQAEQLREIVQTAADNYGGVLDSIKGDLAAFRHEWRNETADTRKVLANHGSRITAIEATLSGS